MPPDTQGTSPARSLRVVQGLPGVRLHWRVPVPGSRSQASGQGLAWRPIPWLALHRHMPVTAFLRPAPLCTLRSRFRGGRRATVAGEEGPG